MYLGTKFVLEDLEDILIIFSAKKTRVHSLSNLDETQKGESHRSKIHRSEFQLFKSPSTNGDTRSSRGKRGEFQLSKIPESSGEFRRPHLPSQCDAPRRTISSTSRKQSKLSTSNFLGESQPSRGYHEDRFSRKSRITDLDLTFDSSRTSRYYFGTKFLSFYS